MLIGGSLYRHEKTSNNFPESGQLAIRQSPFVLPRRRAPASRKAPSFAKGADPDIMLDVLAFTGAAAGTGTGS